VKAPVSKSCIEVAKSPTGCGTPPADACGLVVEILAAPTDVNTVWRGWETRSVVLAEPEPGFDQLQWHVPAAPATRL
jgi:hypothetical protein